MSTWTPSTVSCELQRRPELRGKPVVVAGSGPRAVVTTASYEARQLRHLLGDAGRAGAPAVPGRDLRRARLRALPRTLARGDGGAARAGRDGRGRWASTRPTSTSPASSATAPPRAGSRRPSHERTGLTCSIGIGPSKLVAKVASDAEKPDGFVELTREQACERFADASPGLVPGIGPKTVERLQRHEITTLGALAADARRAAARAVRRAARPAPGRARALRGRPPAGDRAGGEVGVARDDVRPRPARPRRARAGAGAADGPALRDARHATSSAAARSASRCASPTSRPSRGRAACTRR